MPSKSSDGGGDALLTDQQGADLLNMGTTRFLEEQKRDDFPAPVWLGPRGKRHVRAELLAWALAQRERPAETKKQRDVNPRRLSPGDMLMLVESCRARGLTTLDDLMHELKAATQITSTKAHKTRGRRVRADAAPSEAA